MFRQLDEYFAGTRRRFDFPHRLHGTPFQEKVWAALRDIPYGETRSYKDIAEAIGHPKAFRAVGMANHANPICIAVPCHRVVGSNGSLTGYAGGVEKKRFLLELEGVDMTRETLVKIERGTQHIRASQLRGIRDALHTTYDALLEERENL